MSTGTLMLTREIDKHTWRNFAGKRGARASSVKMKVILNIYSEGRDMIRAG